MSENKKVKSKQCVTWWMSKLRIYIPVYLNYIDSIQVHIHVYYKVQNFPLNLVSGVALTLTRCRLMRPIRVLSGGT